MRRGIVISDSVHLNSSEKTVYCRSLRTQEYLELNMLCGYLEENPLGNQFVHFVIRF